MIVITNPEMKDELVKILALDTKRRKHVLKILLHHGKEQGMPEDVQGLLMLCCNDKYAAKVRRSLI